MAASSSNLSELGENVPEKQFYAVHVVLSPSLLVLDEQGRSSASQLSPALAPIVSSLVVGAWRIAR